ncbi:hypothetical protein PR048_017171 [Dryococelus australis]|uniref:RNA-directed DNA polymerase n=1 Tax=Dryococelus australis TaxID=614101 RepID=A0ABQ9H8Y2_9NEOP|nr:hypothetical protein PR048_017171 [Dryococelus australis]
MKSQFEDYWKPVIPKRLVNKFVWQAHLLLGHVRASKVYEAARRIAFWSGMQKDVTKVVGSCVTCQKAKHPQEHLRGILQPILTSKPPQVVSVDIFGPLPKSKAGTKYIFVVMDVFTKYIKHYALSKATAQVLLTKMVSFVEEAGKPKTVLSDKGTQFTSYFWQQGMEDMGIVATTAAVRHPQGNPVERRMKTIGSTFRAYCNKAQQGSRDYLSLIGIVMNHTLYVSTSVTSHEALTCERTELL